MEMSFQKRTSKIRMEKTSWIFLESRVEHRYIIYFLFNDSYENVCVEEVKEIDFSKVIQHLDGGGEVFIAHRNIESFQGEEKVYLSIDETNGTGRLHSGNKQG